MNQRCMSQNIANLVGADAALILNYIYFWCEKNKQEKKAQHKGTSWMYMSYRKFTKHLTHLSAEQIKYRIKTLLSEKLLVTGNFNANEKNNQKWYTVTPKAERLMGILSDKLLEENSHSNKNEYGNFPIDYGNIPTDYGKNTTLPYYKEEEKERERKNPPSSLDLTNGETRDSETPSLGGGGILDSEENVTPSPDPVAAANQDSKSDSVDKLISAIPDCSPHFVATIITKHHDKLKLKPDDIPRFAKVLAEKVNQKLAENNDGQINRAASMISGQIKSGYWTYEPKSPTVRAILTPEEREFMSECKYYEQNGIHLMPENIKARYLEIKARIAKNKPQAKGKTANDNGCSQAIKQLVQNVRQNTASRANL